MNGMLKAIGQWLLMAAEETGSMLLLATQSLREMRTATQHPRRIYTQMKRVGVDSLPIASAMGIFTGMVLALHTGFTLRKFDFESATASIVALSMVKEMGPVLTAMLLAGRVGASIAAEIGTMQVNEEIDALHTLGISPIRYLAMPRLLACITMLPVLVTYAGAVGILGGAAIASSYFEIGYSSFFDLAFHAMEFSDLVEGMLKAICFGGIVATVACQRGFHTSGGAEGVGRAITSCVVTSFVYIFICNYFVTWIMV